MLVGTRPLGSARVGGERACDGSTDFDSFVTDHLAKHLFGVFGHGQRAVRLGSVWANECGSDDLSEFGGYFREDLKRGLRDIGHPGRATAQHGAQSLRAERISGAGHLPENCDAPYAGLISPGAHVLRA